MREVDLAKHVIAWLEADGAEVWQEVQAGERADIVALRGPLLSVVEVKCQTSFYLLAQGVRWLGKAHHVWIATPMRRFKFKEQEVIESSCQHYGVGWLAFYDFEIGHYSNKYPIKCYPSFNRRADASRIKNRLCDEQKSFAPAGSNGKYWTPFKAVVRDVKNFVDKNPGCLLRDVINGIESPYNRNKQQFMRLIARIVVDSSRPEIPDSRYPIPSVKKIRDGRFVRLYPNEDIVAPEPKQQEMFEETA